MMRAFRMPPSFVTPAARAPQDEDEAGFVRRSGRSPGREGRAAGATLQCA